MSKCVSINATAPPPATLPSSTQCKFLVSPALWKPYMVICMFTIVVMLCFQEAPPDVLLLSGAAILCAAGIISYQELFAGFSSGSVIGLGLLGPISAAIEESGIMEKDPLTP